MDSEIKKVFNYILHRGGCLKFEDLLKHPSPLGKLTEQDAEKWFFSRETNNNFAFIIERKQDGALVSVKLYFKTRFCVKYQETGSCKKENCDYGWHLCKRFVDGNCDDSSKCQLSHDFHDKKNSRKTSELGIEKASNSVLRKIIANCLPRICPYYLENNCRLKRKCQNLHVCANYVKNFSCDENLCGFNSHSMQDPHNKELLAKFDLSPYVKPAKNVLVNILIGKETSSSKEKQPETKKQFKQEPRLDLNLGEKVDSNKEKKSKLPKGKGQDRRGKKDQENVAGSGDINDLNIPFKQSLGNSWTTVQSSSEPQWPQAGSVKGQEVDQSYLRLRQGMQHNLIRNVPSLKKIPSGYDRDQRPFQQLRPAFSVDSLHNPTCVSSSGMDNITSLNIAMSQGLELNKNQQKVTRGRGFSSNRGNTRGRGARYGDNLVNKQEQQKERKLMMEDEKFERGGMVSHIGRGRGQRRGRGRAKGGETSNQLGNRNKAESERNTLAQSVANQDEVKMLNEPEERNMNLDECCSQEQKKKRSRQRQRKSKQKIDNVSTKIEEKPESKELIDFSDGSASDEDSSTLLIDLSTDLSQDQYLFEPLSQTPSMENWFEGDYTLSQDSSHSLSQFDLLQFDSLKVLQENPSKETNPLSLQSPSNTITNVPLEKAIFDVLCKEYNCVAKFSEIVTRPYLFPSNVTDIESWFRMHSNSFQLTENERGEVETVSAFSRTARMCFRYNASSGNCNLKNCTYFHVCNEMVATGVCSFGATCTMNHNLQDKKNKSIARHLKLSELSDDQLCALMRASAPQVCLKYNMAGCPKKEKCEKVCF